MSFNIIVKRYEGYNSALGKYIGSKRQYDNEMSKQGMVSFEKAEQIAESVRSKQKKPYILSGKAKQIINSARFSSDKDGKVHLSDRLVEGMKEVGVNFYNNNLPKHYQDKGGFEDAASQRE